MRTSRSQLPVGVLSSIVYISCLADFVQQSSMPYPLCVILYAHRIYASFLHVYAELRKITNDSCTCVCIAPQACPTRETTPTMSYRVLYIIPFIQQRSRVPYPLAGWHSKLLDGHPRSCYPLPLANYRARSTI